MSNPLHGEVIYLGVHQDGTGNQRLTAIALTTKGPVAGVMCAPANGGTGQWGFHPVDDLQHVVEAVGFARAPVVVAEAPVAPVDPDDPRGLRARTRSRAPGMRA